MTLEKTYQHELNRAIRQQKLYAKDAIKKITYDLVANAIEKTATEIIDTKTITFIDLPNDDFKKKIIGKDGRNIKAIMKFAEVDVIIDETPRMVKISSFDPIKREIAARSITELINSNLIQPVRIESVITQQKNNFENIISEIGNDAISELELENVHPKLIYYLGKLKFRTSYGQNVLIHSIEVGKLSGLMAAELQLNVSLAKRAGLLHDIGKAVTHEVEGSHVYHGAILAQKYGEPKEVINAIYSHHNDVEKNNLYSFLVSAADTLSAARLGARNDSLEDFITRIKEIESLCYSVSGVINAYALQSGRQICVIVNEKVIDDLMIHTVTQNIKELIRNSNIIIPGHMQITVIRELRIQEMIK
jgi:ribonuclease Y